MKYDTDCGQKLFLDNFLFKIIVDIGVILWKLSSLVIPMVYTHWQTAPTHFCKGVSISNFQHYPPSLLRQNSVWKRILVNKVFLNPIFPWPNFFLLRVIWQWVGLTKRDGIQNQIQMSSGQCYAGIYHHLLLCDGLLQKRGRLLNVTAPPGNKEQTTSRIPGGSRGTFVQ